jgi:hypothetical protein
MKTLTINFFFPIWLALAIWCGVTNRASVWTIVLILLMSVKLTKTIHL